MNIRTEEQYKKAKARLTQLSRHGNYADASEFEELADAVEAWETRDSESEYEDYSFEFAENIGA